MNITIVFESNSIFELKGITHKNIELLEINNRELTFYLLDKQIKYDIRDIKSFIVRTY